MNGGCSKPRVIPSLGESEAIFLPENKTEQKPQQNNVKQNNRVLRKT